MERFDRGIPGTRRDLTERCYGKRSSVLALAGPASKLLSQLLRPVSCSSLKAESESCHLQAACNLESLYERPEDVLFSFSPGMVGFSHHIFSPSVDSELLSDKMLLNPFLGRSLHRAWNFLSTNLVLVGVELFASQHLKVVPEVSGEKEARVPETVGCKIHEDSHPRGFRLLHFNRELLLSCSPEAHGCALPQSSAQTLAVEVVKSWDTDGFLSKHYQAHVQGELCGRLRGYLESWTGFVGRTVPPAVNVTRSQDSEGMVHLTGKAFGIFPGNISVVWFRDEEPMSREAQESGGVLPDGNGTYFTWETIKIPQGEEERVKCIVGHSGNHSAHLAPLEPISLQDLDQFQTEPTDHNGLTHPEFQSLCQTPAPSV
ncbi:hypothetical protein JEQ12_010523 [Ovis aries]|uniref:Ig-like domain-containing protein n=1 Tax=Ovis aries TaxID=9940 RepID=A0A835ZQ91_SHEEP|nr:hypothetical protein JEQ12_010523 [Ovis aries]